MQLYQPTEPEIAAAVSLLTTRLPADAQRIARGALLLPALGYETCAERNGYWQDEDLQSVLWQNREAEIIQSVHRSRLTVRDVTVWLLSSLPVAELPLSELITIRDMFGAPEGVNVHLWAKLIEAAKQHDDMHGGVTVADIMRLIDVGRVTAEKYFGLLASDPDWEKVSAVTQRKRGRPPQILRQILG